MPAIDELRPPIGDVCLVDVPVDELGDFGMAAVRFYDSCIAVDHWIVQTVCNSCTYAIRPASSCRVSRSLLVGTDFHIMSPESNISGEATVLPKLNGAGSHYSVCKCLLSI